MPLVCFLVLALDTYGVRGTSSLPGRSLGACRMYSVDSQTYRQLVSVWVCTIILCVERGSRLMLAKYVRTCALLCTGIMRIILQQLVYCCKSSLERKLKLVRVV